MPPSLVIKMACLAVSFMLLYGFLIVQKEEQDEGNKCGE